MKPIVFLVIAVGLTFALPFLATPATSGDYLTLRESKLVGTTDITGPNIILMIGDGMGVEQINLARLVEVGEGGLLSMDKIGTPVLMTTNSSSSDITDSAAAGTAIACGKKTINDYVGVGPDGKAMYNIAEIAKLSNMSTGVVSTAELTHATPASFIAHVPDRNDYGRIAYQTVHANTDVMLAGGSSQFSEDQLSTFEERGYEVTQTTEELLSAPTGKIVGLFSSGHFPFVQALNPSVPSLAQLTQKSLDVLGENPEGFFLMVEGARIDHAGHSNDPVNVALETISFDKAVQVARDYVDAHPSTLLIVTADHETGGLQVQGFEESFNFPSDGLSVTENTTLRIQRTLGANVSWTTDYHTPTKVPLYMYGRSMTDFTNSTTIDNTEVFGFMLKHLNLKAPIGSPIVPSITDENNTSKSSNLPSTNDEEIGGFGIFALAIPLIVVGKKKRAFLTHQGDS